MIGQHNIIFLGIVLDQFRNCGDILLNLCLFFCQVYHYVSIICKQEKMPTPYIGYIQASLCKIQGLFKDF